MEYYRVTFTDGHFVEPIFGPSETEAMKRAEDGDRFSRDNCEAFTRRARPLRTAQKTEPSDKRPSTLGASRKYPGDWGR